MDKELRKLIAKVITTEGCGCCNGREHDRLQDELAEKLNIPMFDDSSGYNWWAVAGEE